MQPAYKLETKGSFASQTPSTSQRVFANEYFNLNTLGKTEKKIGL